MATFDNTRDNHWNLRSLFVWALMDPLIRIEIEPYSRDSARVALVVDLDQQAPMVLVEIPDTSEGRAVIAGSATVEVRCRHWDDLLPSVTAAYNAYMASVYYDQDFRLRVQRTISVDLYPTHTDSQN